MKKLSSDELMRPSPEAALNEARNSIVVLLDDVRSAHNVGSIFRTCDAFLVQEVILCGITPTPPHREISKTALGSTKSVKWRHFEKIEAAIEECKERGYRVSAIEHTDSSIQLQNMDPQYTKNALILGSEVNGVSDTALGLCDEAIEIPMFGSKHSFNVSVCAGITLWECWRINAGQKSNT